MIGTLIRPALSRAQTGGRRTSGRPSGLVAAFALLLIVALLALLALAASGDLATVAPVDLAAAALVAHGGRLRVGLCPAAVVPARMALAPAQSRLSGMLCRTDTVM